MVTKWKGWTARRPVKIVSFILFIVLCVAIVACAGSIDFRVTDTGVSLDVAFSDVEGGEYFASMYMSRAYNYASALAYYGSEASIRAGEHLKWFEHNEGIRLSTPEDNQTYMWFDQEDDSPERREQHWNDAVNQQLGEFQNAVNYLSHAPGLLYRIEFTDGTKTITNAEVDDYRAMPVYVVQKACDVVESSHGSSIGYPHYYNYLYEVNMFLAFTREAVDAQTSVYSAAKTGYIRDFTLIALSCILLVVLLVIQLLGAGRKTAGGGEGVHFVVVDRLPLDIGAAIIIFWLCLIALAINDYGYSIIHYGNYKAVTLLCCTVAVLSVAPILLWLLSLVKRIKAGKFWRHTLVYMILRGITRFAKSQWCGFPLMLKVGLIGAAAFFALIFTGLTGAPREGFLLFLVSLIITAGTVFLLLRYAKRLHALERGAKSVSSGNYGEEINAGGGELGSIAHSIMNISDGINSAVEQRMKSERLKTELITNVSHDIRTPLTSIITYTDLLSHEGLASEKAPEYLDIIVQKSQRLKTLTDELFEAAKAATGNIDVNITELDLTSLVNQVLGEMDGAINASTLDLRVNLPTLMPVRADGKLMWRVMENLMSNVFKYALRGSRVYLSAERAGDQIRLELKNISATELNVDPAELTERFKRGDEARVDGGSGLGLSIVQSFVEAQRGRFVLSIDGDLFKATVYLPAAACGGVNS